MNVCIPKIPSLVQKAVGYFYQYFHNASELEKRYKFDTLTKFVMFIQLHNQINSEYQSEISFIQKNK